MDFLTITFVFWIAWINCLHGKKHRTDSDATNATVETQHARSNKFRSDKVNLILPKCIDAHNKATMYQILEKHNDARKHPKPKASDMLKMVWSGEAAKNAETYGKKCDYKHSPLEERTVGRIVCGENLVMSPGPMNWPEVIDAWFDEEEFFTYGVGGVPGQKIGHYTQIVHAKSYYLGCSVVPCFDFYFFICQYCPSGNIVTSLNTPYKAGEPCGSCKDHCEDGLCINQCIYFDEAGNCPELKGQCSNPGVVKMCEATCKCST